MASINELKEVLKEQLESSGALNDVRCRLRAEIFRALNDSAAAPPAPSAENALVIELVREFLLFNNYHHSLGVLRAETGVEGEQLPREALAQQLRVEEDEHTRQLPLLYSLVFGSRRPAAEQKSGYRSIFGGEA